MHKHIRSIFALLTIGLLVIAGTGCTKKAKASRHLAQADTYFAAGEYDKAEIEYKNVLQLEPLNASAIGQLGIIYFDESRPLFAKSFLKKASELSPDNLELQFKLAMTDAAFGDLASARTKAGLILDRAPQHADAPILLAQTAANPKEMAETVQRLKKLPPANVESAPVYIALGLMELRQNKIEAAEAAYKRALTLNPKSAEAHAAMAAIHLVRKETALAEAELKLAADLAPARSSHRIQYAQFKIQQGDVAGGRKLLEQMTQATPDYLPAWMGLAQLASIDKKYDEALVLVGKVLTRDNTYPEALLLSARLRMAKGDFAPAVTELERTLKMFPNSPQFLYQLGLAYVASGDTKKAVEVLNRALAQSPGFTDATVLLAGLNMRSGEQGAAISALKIVVQQHPELIQPWLLLADAYRSRGNFDEALAVYDQIEKNFPNNPRTPLLKGTVLLQQKKRAEARQAFNLALERDPDLQPAVEQLVNLDLLDKQYDAARQRVEKQLVKQPKSPEMYMMLARIFAAQKDLTQAETALKKAIELQPEAPAAYFMLTGLYMGTNQQQKALDNLKQILAVNPKDTRALLMTGVLYQQLKSYDNALAAYEKLLAIDPKSGVALNNAAVLYSEHFNQLDKAFDAAKRARELYPRDPNLADTYGWILLKKRQYPLALIALQESAEKLPNSAEIQYHLGMAHYLMGEEAPARVALENALKSNEEFAGIEEARKRLALLKLDPSKADPAVRKAVEAALVERPDDPIALLRLAAIQEREGAMDKATDSYEAVLKTSPGNVTVMLNLIRLYTAQKEPTKAFELAKSARKLAPDSIPVALTLARLAYQTQDYPRAYSLMQETTRKQPDDAAGLRDLAKAAYSVGQVGEAEVALQQSLQLDAVSTGAIEARNFLELIQLANDPVQATAASARISQALKSNPANVPALMVAATISEQKPDALAAITTYEKVLGQFPDFNPAKKQLTILYAATMGDNKRAFELARKARVAFPDDAELAKAYGIILFRQEDYTLAQTMLKESVAKRSDDAELMYYLGMTQYRLGDRVAAKQSLLRAADLKLKNDLAADARKVLSELK